MPDAMEGVQEEKTVPVFRAAPADLDRLVTQLEQHGTRSAKIRFALLLLRNGVNKAPYDVFYSGWSKNIIVILCTKMVHFYVVSAFAPDDPASPARLASLLRRPELLASVWSNRFRMDGWADTLVPVLEMVADELGFSYSILTSQISFARPAGLPQVRTRSRTGVGVALLHPKHIEIVKHYWPYTANNNHASTMISESIVADLSAGAFVTGSPPPPANGLGHCEEPVPADGLASWMVVNHNGDLGFLHTLIDKRQRGLASLVMGKLTQISESAGYPPVLHTNHPAVSRVAKQLGYEELFSSSWGIFDPSAAL